MRRFASTSSGDACFSIQVASAGVKKSTASADSMVTLWDSRKKPCSHSNATLRGPPGFPTFRGANNGFRASLRHRLSSAAAFGVQPAQVQGALVQVAQAEPVAAASLRGR